VLNKEALGYFEDSRYEDYRINAYPPFTEYHGINRASISFLMADLDERLWWTRRFKKRQIIRKGFKLSLREN
jgi:hypothetical protein